MQIRSLTAAFAVAGLAWACSEDEAAVGTPGAGGSAQTGGASGTGGSSPSAGSGGRGGSTGGQSGGGSSGIAGSGGSDAAVDGGGAAGRDAGDASADTTSAGDVVGVVTNGFGPGANIAVVVDGVTYVTNAQGKFTVPGVGATYDATVIFQAGGQTQVYAFLGLATRAPAIQITSDVTVQSATVSGQLAGGAGFPNSASHRAAVGSVRPGEVLSIFPLAAAEGPGYGPMTLRWAGTPSVDATLFALQWTVDTNGLPSAYDGWATKTLTVSNGGSFGQPDGGAPATNLTLGAVSDRTLNGTAQVPSGLTIARKSLLIGGVGAARPVNDVTPGASYQYRVPTGLSPVEVAFRATATGTSGEAADTIMRVSDSTANLDVDLLTVPVAVLPIAGATQVDYDTTFTITGPPNTVHSVMCQEIAGTVTFTIYTMGTSVKIPNLTSAGIPLKRGASYTWVAAADGPATQLEDLLVQPAAFFAAHGVRANAFSTERTFTVAP